ncbi:MAG: hypothetical protein A3F04_00615 [Candidatus Chisholmbacteria bacterium RIFCSPHIGHO2_12_FULL_49_9]|uniref:Gcp-like domain-containing protein n=1 Tax=Candidatus Chisholmbacteria bacterium RIFCSPHIGHO2_01_FULL_52_32 TaxID=1797591 RepID=A0A1G1VTC0_9BACT|nr:MAG: hypothetical protein A2786_04025 [Candidatus Chisholmbacteria bacterium RIFCSPHIGHO2_01_FULL_52_32]OGY19990.1 MAG: hypothetical protein A2900_02720 [Candidatus Chisholmbacteria bacterium RIFCSPLOWO2_01_FULL_50_28]OGY21618.1 MAG: hypothetical protein A3F04_00615 [Candidatus Chisholmbacteria bacterium RIFCSPHIGHO2_12_FULL_49_9]
MLLFIDTTDSKRIVVRIETTELVKSIRSPRGEDVLKLIDEVLKKAGTSKEKLTEIQVNPGPSPDLNVGVAVANALGASLKIPVNHQKPGVFVKPIYKE